MASVYKLLRIQHMVGMSSLVHVVEDIHLNRKLIAGITSIHLSAGQVELPLIKSSATVDVV